LAFLVGPIGHAKNFGGIRRQALSQGVSPGQKACIFRKVPSVSSSISAVMAMAKFGE
jgi:hypothetical protein